MVKKLFFLILGLAFVFRFYKLGTIPLSLDWDEVSNGYNAYSILHTARNEYGNFLPLANRSFDDYKPPLYMYLNVPSVAIFGLNEFAVRFPSALFGFLTVPLIYLLSNYLFKDDKHRNKISLSAMFLFAISPWSIQFSRVGFEANVALFFTVLSIVFFLYSLKKHKLLILSSISACLSIYSYHTQKLFIPLIFLALFMIFIKDLKLFPKKIIFCFFLVTFLLVAPLFLYGPKQALFSRYQTTSNQEKLAVSKKATVLIGEDNNTYLGKILHNRKIITTLGMSQNYLANFDLNFLFTKGDDNGRHHIENMGMFYLFQLPLLLIGLYLLITKHDKATQVILSWLLLAPIASSFATPSPHAIRSLPLIIPIEIMCAFGLTIILDMKNKKRVFFAGILMIWMFASIIIYLHNYSSHYPQEKAADWQYGFKQAVTKSENLKDNYSGILVDPSLEQAYVYWLFYTKYDPKAYQLTGSNKHFDKYYFDADKPKTADKLFISLVDTAVYPKDFNVIDKINYPNGKPAISLSVHP